MKCPKCFFENSPDANFCNRCATRLIFPPEETSSHNGDTKEIYTELSPGSIFAGRYQVIEELGRGGMGKVYKVHDLEVNEKIALKLLKPDIAGDEKFLERFRDELKLARQISHRNVCRMFDLNKQEGVYYITMEYVPGEDLKSMLRMMGPLSSGKAILVIKQVCKGLAEAHRRGIVHLDLKPQNIMIDKDGVVRIMDFGIARSLKIGEKSDYGALIGTLAYMSPEQLEGKDVDHRSDIYSLGVILYEVVTGELPFEAETPGGAVWKQMSLGHRDARRISPSMPKDLSRLILRCLEKDRLKRYQDLEEVLQELREIQKGVPTTDGILPRLKSDSEDLKEPSTKNSIAVLPFNDLSPERDQDYFCDGMTEELISALAKIDELKVASRTSAFQFKGERQDIRQIGEKLKVGTILEGSVRKSGNRLRITAQLIDAKNGFEIWSEKYDRDLADIFTIQEEISLAIVDSLKVNLLREEREALVKRSTKNAEAYKLYLKGRYFWNRRYEGGLQKGIEFFSQAIEKDPQYALAYAGIADSYSLLAHYGFAPPRQASPKAKAAAEKAIALDDNLAEAHASLGRIKLHYDWDWPGAEKELKRALELNPRYATAQEWYSLYLMIMGRFEEAVAEAKRALEIDPLSLIINAVLGGVYYFAGMLKESLEQFRRTLEIDPNFSVTYLFQAGALEATGRLDEAVDSLQKLVLLTGKSPFALGYYGGTLALAGKREEALKIRDDLVEISQKRFVSPFYVAMIYVGLKDKENAFTYLEKAYEERESFMAFINTWPVLEALRPDPRFQDLVKRMGFRTDK